MRRIITHPAFWTFQIINTIGDFSSMYFTIIVTAVVGILNYIVYIK